MPMPQCCHECTNFIITFKLHRLLLSMVHFSWSWWVSTSFLIPWNDLFFNVGNIWNFALLFSTLYFDIHIFTNMFWGVLLAIVLWSNQCESQILIWKRGKMIYSDLRIHVSVSLGIRCFSTVLSEHWTIQYFHHLEHRQFFPNVFMV